MPTPVSEAVRTKVAKAILAGDSLPDIATANHVSESFVAKLKKKLQGGDEIKTPRVKAATLPPASSLPFNTSQGYPAPRKRKLKKAPVAAPVDALLGVLDAGALPHLRAERDRLCCVIDDAHARLERVQALVRLHDSGPSPVSDKQLDLRGVGPAGGMGCGLVSEAAVRAAESRLLSDASEGSGDNPF
jgi:hypothetical protein